MLIVCCDIFLFLLLVLCTRIGPASQLYSCELTIIRTSIYKTNQLSSSFLRIIFLLFRTTSHKVYDHYLYSYMSCTDYLSSNAHSVIGALSEFLQGEFSPEYPLICFIRTPEKCHSFWSYLTPLVAFLLPDAFTLV